jgi:predicted Rossmann fold flavoprotein
MEGIPNPRVFSSGARNLARTKAKPLHGRHCFATGRRCRLRVRGRHFTASDILYEQMAVIEKYDVLILGAGAAGLMCAVEASKRGRRVALLERANRIGKKILISGGGRCNFTNIHCTSENFISANPHFAKSALARYTPADFVALVEKHSIPYYEKTLGQLFCDHAANDITDMLERECHSGGVKTFLEGNIHEVIRTTEFIVRTDGIEFHAPVLVVATGGLSIPKMGATAFGYDLARDFGLKIQQTKPGLVPLVLNTNDQKDYCNLAGVSADVIVACANQSFSEAMLITHRGLSGPAILQASSYWESGKPIHVDLAPGQDVTSAVRQGKVRNAYTALSALQRFLPSRLAERWLEMNWLNGNPAPQWTNQALEDLERRVHRWTLVPSRTEGYQKAEVTAGGVDTDELSAKTMESCKVPGLFFIGEVVDVTGHLGGHNFQWAWSSGVAAGRAL